ncbi:MAG: hypothetical protein LBS35_02815 [Synergistaceae bacterium]|jgi:xanthine/uracil/vitamin C permease (AzgA family)|nr:hypothetical protein [Synergistaceae bacterium]
MSKLILGIIDRVSKLILGIFSSVLKLILGIFGLLMLIVLLVKLIDEDMIWQAVLVIVLSFLLGITAIVLRHRHLKRQQDIDILKADIRKIGDDETARLAEKYQNR